MGGFCSHFYSCLSFCLRNIDDFFFSSPEPEAWNDNSVTFSFLVSLFLLCLSFLPSLFLLKWSDRKLFFYSFIFSYSFFLRPCASKKWSWLFTRLSVIWLVVNCGFYHVRSNIKSNKKDTLHWPSAESPLKSSTAYIGCLFNWNLEFYSKCNL